MSYNVLFVSHMFPPYFWWWQAYVAWNYAKWLLNKWNNITVITHQFTWLKKQEVIEDISIVRFPSVSKLLFNLWLFYPRWLYQWLENNIRHYDIVFIHGLYSFYEYITFKICKKYWIPYILMPHGVWNVSKQREKVFLKRLFILFFSQFVSKHAEKVIFCSKNEQEDYEIPYKDGIVINNWIDQNYRTSEMERITDADLKCFNKKRGIWDKKIILSMWRLAYWKRFDKVIAYLSRFLKENIDYILLIVWPDWWELENLKKQVADSWLDGKVKIIQWLYDKEKIMIFKRSTLFVLASDHEWFPIVICEAISANLPCIISKECNVEWFEGFVEIFNTEPEFKRKFDKILKGRKRINKNYIKLFDVKESIDVLDETVFGIINT